MYVLVCIGLFSTPFAADFGPGLERASEGAQLDGEFAFYASRRRLRAWHGGGRQLDGDISFHSSRRRLRDWPGGGAEGRAAGRGILLCASRHRLRAWPGWGGWGRAGGRGICFSTLLAANFRPGLDEAVEGCAALAWSLPFSLSLTGLSMGGQAMLCHWSEHHLRL